MAMKFEQPHLTIGQLRAFSLGELSDEEFAAVESHLAHCDECCQQLSLQPENTLLALAREVATIDNSNRGQANVGSEKQVSSYEIPTDLENHPRYKILEQIGVGGMGSVYKAEHRLMRRTVALKLVHPWLLTNPQAVERFEKEVRLAARLSHPNIVLAHDADQTSQRHFLVMEYVFGETLHQRVASSGPVRVEQALDWIGQAAQGLQHAFEQGMAHRDIKPQNLMVTEEGRVRILDFGLSRLFTEQLGDPAENRSNQSSRMASLGSSDAGQGHSMFMPTDHSMILGTPDYIAPEQIVSSTEVDIRADIYSLGCTLFFLLVGYPPFRKPSVPATLMAQKTQALPDIRQLRSDVDSSVAAILAKMTAKNPKDRYSTPKDLLDALTSSNTLPIIAPAGIHDPNPQRLKTRRLVLIGCVFSILAALVLGATFWNSTPKRLLVMLPSKGLWYPDYEDLKLAARRLGRRNVELVFASLADRPSELAQASRKGIAVPDIRLNDQVHAKDFDGMIFIGFDTSEFSPGGAARVETKRLINEFHMQKKVLAGLCAGQRVLAQHGALQGKRVTPCVSVRDDEILVEGGQRGTENVIVDGLVVTAASSQYSYEFLEKLLNVEDR